MTEREKDRKDSRRKDKSVDKAGDMSFPASDPPAAGRATSTEPPARPTDRRAPAISREQIEAAQRSEGHDQPSGRGRKPASNRKGRTGSQG
jgi:hypothetical protein